VLQESLRGLGETIFRLQATAAHPPQPCRSRSQQAEGTNAAMEEVSQHQTAAEQSGAHQGGLEPGASGKRGDRHETALTPLSKTPRKGLMQFLPWKR
jgi:hypothetical protein